MILCDCKQLRASVTWGGVILIWGVVWLWVAAGSTVVEAAAIKPAQAHLSMVRVNVTSQRYSVHRPWQQLRPTTQTAIGAIIQGGRVLVTARPIANHRFIELEKIDSGKKAQAEVVVVDYEANLALLKPMDPEFLMDTQSLDLDTSVVQDDQLTIWQVKPNGIFSPSRGPVTSIELIYFTKGQNFLGYRLNNSLQLWSGNHTLPVTREGKLVGMLLRHDAKSQTSDVIAAPMIEHFLKDIADNDYRGFPNLGLRVATTEDPQLRAYLGLADTDQGIYVEQLRANGPGEKAGLKQGDVITRINGYPIDNRGHFEHPLYGKLAMSHLVRCEYQAGDMVGVEVFSKGALREINIHLDHRDLDAYLVPPYLIDQRPKYKIFGGLVLQELTAQYLREYGKNWRREAPLHLLYYFFNQDVIDTQGREKIVMVSGVLPTHLTRGYESLGNLVLTRLNQQPIGSLDDVTRALQSPVKGFHKFEFEQSPRTLYLDPQEVPEIDRQVMERYQIKELTYPKTGEIPPVVKKRTS